MKHKNIFITTFILSLFVFQPVQASTTLRAAENPLQNSVASPHTNILYNTVYVYVYKLVDGSGALQPSPELCSWPLDSGVYGCGFAAPPIRDSVGGFFYLNVEQDYLPDVLATEMNLVQISPHIEALSAQAIASRTVASWKTRWASTPVIGADGQEYPTINNSSQFQVYIPGANDSSGAQSEIDAAVSNTQGRFLQYIIGNSHAIDSEFGADMELATGDGDLASAPYLKGIEDPISVSCIVDISGSHDYGMSQRGAIRWAKGNTCPDESGSIWPVIWNHHQILTHYYRGIDIIDDATGLPVVPGDRWNLINHTIPLNNNRLGNADAGQTYGFNITLQNTSTADWGDGNTKIGYQWTAKGNAAITGQWNEFVGASVSATDRGTPLTSLDLVITVPSTFTEGDYTLHLDLYRNGHWFSEQTPRWSDAAIDIHVNGSIATPTLTPLPATATTTPTLISGVLSCNTVASGVTCTNYGTYLDYSININVSGLTGGATASSINIGTYKRSTNGGYMGMMSDFFHSETSNFTQNTLLSLVRINTFDAGAVNYDSFTNGPGSFTSLTNKVNAWRFIEGTANFPNTLQVRGNVDWPITGYSISGHIYLYSNENFVIGPTPTVTPLPTLTPEPCNCPTDFLALGELYCNIFGSNSKLAAPVSIRALQTAQQAILDVQLFHRVEDEVLSQTLQGQHYIQLYYGHGPEIIELLRNNPTLKDEAISTLQLWEPNLQALVDGEGSNVTITSGQVQAAQTFLDHLYSLGSAELRQTIDSERALKPLESTVGMTMNQASTYLVNFQIEPTAAPATNTATATLTPSITYTSTNTPTNTVTFTPVVTETPTFTPSPTVTVSPSDTTTPLPEDTFTPSPTPSPTVTEAIVNTSTPTDVATLTPTETILPTETPAYTASLLYLHGTGPAANPPTLFLDSLVPVGTTVKYKDSTSVNFNNGNVWKEIGTWITSPSSSQLISLNELHTWLGLKNSDDQGARFDVRAEIYKNDELVTSGETYCITNITRNANQAKEVIVLFDEFDPVSLDNSMDELSIKILTRIGTDGAGAFCGGHSNAVGLRLYFDASNRPAGFDGVFIP